MVEDLEVVVWDELVLVWEVDVDVVDGFDELIGVDVDVDVDDTDTADDI